MLADQVESSGTPALRARSDLLRCPRSRGSNQDVTDHVEPLAGPTRCLGPRRIVAVRWLLTATGNEAKKAATMPRRKPSRGRSAGHKDAPLPRPKSASSEAEPKRSRGYGKPVSFMRDVAPILVENCIACHNPRKSESKYVMTTFAQLAKGGQQGEGITLEPGKPDESNLVELIRPDGQPRMPLQAGPAAQGKDRDHRALGRGRGQVRRQLARRGLDDPLAQDAAGHDSRGLSRDGARSRRLEFSRGRVGDRGVGLS